MLHWKSTVDFILIRIEVVCNLFHRVRRWWNEWLVRALNSHLMRLISPVSTCSVVATLSSSKRILVCSDGRPVHSCDWMMPLNLINWIKHSTVPTLILLLMERLTSCYGLSQLAFLRPNGSFWSIRVVRMLIPNICWSHSKAMISKGLLIVSPSIVVSLTLELGTCVHSIPLILLVALTTSILINKSLKTIY